MRVPRHLSILFTVFCFCMGGYVLWQGHERQNPAGVASDTPAFHMSDRLSTLKVETTPQGQVFRFETPAGPRTYSPEAFAAEVAGLQAKKHDGGWGFRVLDITSIQSLLWVLLGFAGQFMFTGRMLVQWIASERAKRSVVPPAFWWMSLCGSSLLIIYFWWRVDVVGILGQATGWIVYIRNLWLLKDEDTPASVK
jgi:lipid-A-disaccharide synthase-like uncharacterized protein